VPESVNHTPGIHSPGPLEVVVGWLDAMRRSDVAEVERWLEPEITWRGVRDAAICRNREDVLEMLRGSLEGGFGAQAVELIPGETGVVLGAKVSGLGEIGGVELRGQLYNVFRVSCGRIAAAEDYAYRDEALAAAAARPPNWVEASPDESVVALVPFIKVTDVERAVSFYELLGFRVVKRHAPGGRLEFAGLRAGSGARLMLALADEPLETGPGSRAPGFIYLYTADLDSLRRRLLAGGHHAEEIEPGPGPTPHREMCVRDPDGHGHMIAELFEGSVATT
jgi:catechol 2,3-dioxygenase-like lactoylglutathione lyase family enzyme